MKPYINFACNTEHQAAMSPTHSERDSLYKNYGAIEPVKGEFENDASSGERQIGLISATFIIFNCMVGAG